MEGRDLTLNYQDYLLAKKKLERSEPSGGFDRSSIGPQIGEEHKVLVVLVLIHHPLTHRFENIVNSFNLSITLGVIRQ